MARLTKHGLALRFERSNRARAEALAAIKKEVVRIGNGTREGFKFAERIFDALPELRSA
jgi:hypothetical protein